ncbi:MAG: phosphoribosyltransferase family protein [Candidatus Moranbacteria bacterium]|nr:phosphoribosyltransferase family protein [Candidatus Moranbacteria bacterium]
MNEQEVETILGSCNAILTNIHVCLTPKADGWYHSDGYVAKDSATKNPRKAKNLYQAMAEQWYGQNVEVVVGPAMGAIAIAQHVALSIAEHEDRDILAIYTEPENPADKKSPHRLSRGFDKDVKGKRVLVTEDILTTGGSAKRTVDAVKKAGGEVMGVIVLANRGGVTPEQLGVPVLIAMTHLKEFRMQTWKASECPSCKELIPLRIDIGKGNDWLKTEEGQAWLAKGGTVIG